jgi:hypothetical protein
MCAFQSRQQKRGNEHAGRRSFAQLSQFPFHLVSTGKIGVGAMVLIEDIVRFADEATGEATKLPAAPTLAEVKSSVTGKERWRLKVKALAHAMALSGWLSHSALLR